jgi:hypothetical protein
MPTQLREIDVDLITRGHLERGLDGLCSEFAGTFSSETIERYMAESLEALSGARLTNFVPCSCTASRVSACAPWVRSKA